MPSPEPTTDIVIAALQSSGVAIETGIRSAVRLALGTTLEHQPTVLTGSLKTGGTVNLLQLYNPSEIPGLSVPTLSAELLRGENVLVLKLQSGGNFTAFLDGFFFFSTAIRFPQDPALFHQTAVAMVGAATCLEAALSSNAEGKGALFKPVPRAAQKDWSKPRPVLGPAPSGVERIEVLRGMAR